MSGRLRDCCSLAYGFQQTKLAGQAASVLPAGAVDLVLEAGALRGYCEELRDDRWCRAGLSTRIIAISD